MLQALTLPDVTRHSVASNASALQWVGMEEIAVPLFVNETEQQRLVAKADVFVSLDKPQAKGIHMSRLHRVINQLADDAFNQETFDRLMDEAIHSQEGISQSAKLSLRFDWLLKKPSLLSDESGFQAYPIAIHGETKSVSPEQGAIQERFYELEITIPYSSTCPCSASLSRQLYANAIAETFPTDGINKAALLDWLQSEAGSIATPHSQRSYAYIKMALGEEGWPALSELILQLEEAIGTPVQTAVKRSDEQEFARLNATNLMFCEDAARRLKSCLETLPFVIDYEFKVEHQESLHAHNAVVIDRKSPR